jgi:MFS-type transporter involved in bile tolerance (Atg22 family)
MIVIGFPIAALWLILAIPVYWTTGGQAIDSQHESPKQNNIVKKLQSPFRIRPPPL